MNPRHITGVADTIAEVLRTPEEVRATRMRSLQRAVREGDVHRWTSTFLGDLLAAGSRVPV